MGENAYQTLKIDERFQRLAYPLDPQSFARLEADILSGLCDEPLVVWNGYLIDGFSRYRVFSDHHLPFRVESMEFACWEAAAAWICARQLTRKDIPDALRRFLIGIQYRSEAAAAKLLRNDKDWFQSGREPICHLIAVRLGVENHVACETVKRFSSFAGTLEDIRARAPKAAEEIMYGKIKIADKHLLELSRLDNPSFQRALHRLGSAQRPLPVKRPSQREAQKLRDTVNGTVLAPSVKDMPVFDPDAEVTGLTLTIPSWSGSIDRIVNRTDLNIVSAGAKERLASALLSLQKKICEMLTAIEVVE